MTTRGYKRSWKNLLINKRYQLRFTLFMVGLALVLMGLLGWWVVRVASEATNVAQSRERGRPCPEAPSLALAPQVTVDPGEMTFDDAPGAGSAAGSGTAAGAGGPPSDSGRHTISLDEPSMRLEPIPAAPIPDLTPEMQDHVRCELLRNGKIAELDRGKQRIVLVLAASCALIVVGLILFGIKMTHRVAGPLYKVTLYLAKLRDGRYDKVYDLRRGDQLVAFYEHFRQAHAGVVALEQGDRARIAAALDAAIADGLLARSPEVKSAADELRAVLERKEKALGHKS